MKTIRLFLLACCLLPSAFPLPFARAQDELRVDHNTRQPTSPVNLSSPNATGVLKLPPTAYIGANWIFASFNDIGSPNETLNLSYSQNGLNWTTTTPNYTAPAGNGVRDSSITHLNGVYYVAYTAGSFGVASYVQICQSTDLVNWTYLCNVNTTGITGGFYTWAPEWFTDRDGTVYLYLASSQAGGTWRVFYATASSLNLTSWSAFTQVGGDMTSRGAIDPPGRPRRRHVLHDLSQLRRRWRHRLHRAGQGHFAHGVQPV